ncbi:hypothetical protein CU254_41945 (plasmid) [Amycolatopsis sp. AA4]|uniref:hypothetical protein n=1 Tax=Actinomycetes TaxID=1760 RepID=UPI0001B56C22|nr:MULTISPECIES: hypothetical protein [Actinomycetes]ATY17142.1 hypothetical protein CU254_41945 [Amycolatopsis sp. AA4]EFL12627.1 predicted protein [Streptomyces sp. AA4]
MPATIKFRAKPETLYNVDGTCDYTRIKVPEIGIRHCAMSEFRSHATLRGLANSDLFPRALRGVLKQMGIAVGGYIRLDQLPDGVTVDASGFLAAVTITVADDATYRSKTR